MRAWLRGVFALVASLSLIDEAVDVLNRPAIRDRYALQQADIDRVITAMLASIITPVPLTALPLHCRDPKDDQFLAAALGGNADYIVSGDADLLSLDGEPTLRTLRIVIVRAFLDVLG